MYLKIVLNLQLGTDYQANNRNYLDVTLFWLKFRYF